MSEVVTTTNAETAAATATATATVAVNEVVAKDVKENNITGVPESAAPATEQPQQQQPQAASEETAEVLSNEGSKDDDNSDKETAAAGSPTESGRVDGELAENSEQEEQAAANATTPAPKGCKKPNFEKDVIYLFQFARTPTVPSMSPYCLKVETWLRLTGLKYENVDHKMKYKSKKGQLPFIELNGEEIADSTFIIKELGQRFEKDLDQSLDNNQKNVSHAMISMIENHLLWIVMWWKCKYPDNVIKGYKMNLQQSLDTRMPNVILNAIFKYSYSRKGLKKVKAQGIGVHTPEEIVEFGKHDLRVLSDMLGDKPYFFGDEPTMLDVVAFPNLSQIYFVDRSVEFSLRDYMIEHLSNLVGHVNRMKDRCFPDWEEICKTLDLNAHLPKSGTADSKEPKSKDEEKKSEKEGDKVKEEEATVAKDKGETATDDKEKEEKSAK